MHHINRVSTVLALSAFLLLPLLAASSCPGRPPIGTCLNPGPTTACPTACKNIGHCYTCCAKKFGASSPGNGARASCDASCEKTFLLRRPIEAVPWRGEADDPGHVPGGIYQGAAVCECPDGARPAMAQEGPDAQGISCERTHVFRDIFAHVPAFFDTQVMRDFVCWLDEEQRNELRNDVLSQQSDIWALSPDDYDDLMEWVDTNVQEIVDMLDAYGELEGTPEEAFAEYRNLFLDQLWFDYLHGVYDPWITQ